MKKYGHAAILPIYLVFYMACFNYLEKTVTKYYVIHMPIDDLIPFCEFFIIPYLVWFVYIAATVVYFAFADKKEYYRLSSFLMIGMTLFLIISYLYPNGQHLRPAAFARDNIFVDLVKHFYTMDTPTNVLPSLHVYNTLGVQISISTNRKLSDHKWILYASLTLSSLIIMSTLYLKQHSMLDVIAAFVMCSVVNIFVYRADYVSNSEYENVLAERRV